MANFTSDSQHKLYDSNIDVVANTVTASGIVDDFENHYIGVRYYSDAVGTPVAPTAGTVTVEVLDEATNQWTAATGSPLTASAITSKATYTGNITAVRATGSGVLTATHYQVFDSANL